MSKTVYCSFLKENTEHVRKMNFKNARSGSISSRHMRKVYVGTTQHTVYICVFFLNAKLTPRVCAVNVFALFCILKVVEHMTLQIYSILHFTGMCP